MEPAKPLEPAPQRPAGGAPSAWPLAVMAVCALVLTGAGCASSGPANSVNPPRSSKTVEELHLVAVPSALNLDGAPGVDGFAVKVYASTARSPKPVAITTGALEILMFDGVVKDDAALPDKPLRIWSFSVKEARAFERKGHIGVSYQFTLAWGEAKPAANRITVIARYCGPRDELAHSAPSVIVLGDH